MPVLNVEWITPEELLETCSVSYQNKFGKLVCLLVYYEEICYQARSHERKMQESFTCCGQNIGLFPVLSVIGEGSINCVTDLC